jgi:hypothetical protein
MTQTTTSQGDSENPQTTVLQEAPSAKPRETRGLLMAALFAVGLTIVFFLPLWRGHGLVGGDIYTYCFPQKAYYAEELSHGRIPFWNPRFGHGYPLLAESQTGVFYPPHLLLYSSCDLNTAYNASLLLHYAVAFVCTWLLSRRLGMSWGGASLVGLVFVYGWFPARLSLEWSIVGGVWLPLSLWLLEGYWQTKRRWRLALLSLALGTQMLAGHFTMAFITQLVVIGYSAVRLVWRSRDSATDCVSWRTEGLHTLIAVVLGFLLAGVQLLPSWELKGLSQRAAVSGGYDPGYGHIPVWYLSQIIVPWDWYGEDVDLNQALPAGSSGTNQVEAHLYFGMVPLALALLALATGRSGLDRRILGIAVLGFLALLLTTGWFVPVTNQLPGFRYFSGPGRYGVVTTLAAALLAGVGLDRLIRNWRRGGQISAACVSLSLTIVDLFLVSRLVSDTVMVPAPPIARLGISPVRELLAKEPQPPRLFCRGANLPTLLGVSSTPLYLGIGPAAYSNPQLKMPEPLPFDEPATAEQVTWLQRAGVTHVLSFRPLDSQTWPVTLVWKGDDRFLNLAWNRYLEGRPLLYLYQLHNSRGRVSFLNSQTGGSARVVEFTAHHVIVEAESPSGGRLVLSELAYPGWNVTIDGQTALPLSIESMYRGVDVPSGKHVIEWAYLPASIRWGTFATLLGVLGLCVLGRPWRLARTPRV